VLLALISDIHGNLPAFQAVLERIDQEGVDAILCLGDTVGYGPNPSECIDLMIERGIPSVLGNHDACVIGKLTDNFFSEPNRGLLRWTREHLRPDQMAWLEGLPMTIGHRTLDNDDSPPMRLAVEGSGEVALNPRFIAAHASPINPEQWEWLDSAITCREVLAQVDYDFVFVGHTHVPALVPDQLGVFGLERGYKFLINPGSIGQGRDHDRRASFGILDFGNFTYRNIRVHYDTAILKAQFDKLEYTKEEIRRLINV
jgi:predicted phosphodiesterase